MLGAGWAAIGDEFGVGSLMLGASATAGMLVAAGSAIGRESQSPVLVDADTARTGAVKLGELKILDVINDPPHAKDTEAK